MIKNILVFAFLLSMVTGYGKTKEINRLFRFPDIHKDQVVFAYAGDLYTVSSNGGTARKLTSHKGYEMFPRFSPDGQYIAFTGQYDGNTEVYIIPSKGGVPKRLTYTATLKRDKISDRMGPNNIVMEWTPDGDSIIYRSRRYSFNSFKGSLFKVAKDGGLSQQIPLSESGFCSYSPNGKQLAFNKVFREFRTWKRYRGGMASDIRTYDFTTGKVQNVTNTNVQDIIPMWHNDRIYFLSDRDNTMNLFAYNNNTDSLSKRTHFTGFDIKFPALGPEHIVFEKGGYIYKYGLQSDTSMRIPVAIHNDQIYARDKQKDVHNDISNGSLSPNGKRIVFTARGDIFTVPAEEGVTYNITRTPGVHEREAVWGPNGKYIAYFSDQTGEYEIFMQKADRSEPPVQLTQKAETYKFNLKWSPDGKKILWNDRKFRLRYVHIDSKETTTVREADSEVIRDFNWSPDSRWITFSEEADNTMHKIFLHNTETESTHYITGKWYHSKNPSFSSDGKYLFFSSARNYQPTISQIEWNYAYLDMCKIYLIPLSQETPSPFKPENAKADIIDNKDQTEDPNNDDKTGSPEVNVDLTHIEKRIIQLPVESSNYSHIQAIKNKVYYYEKSAKEGSLTLKMYNLDKEKEKTLGSGIRYTLSPQNNKMLVKRNQTYQVIDLPGGKINLSDPVDLTRMEVTVDYNKEWRQIFNESWRQIRDFFYVPNMHGVDWKDIKHRYSQLLPYVNHRDDLTYIIGEMIGELNAGHAYVQSGERPKAERIKTGLLGADLSRHSSGFYRIDSILEGANWHKKLRSPLQQIDVDVNEGDYILAVNERPTNQTNNIYSLLTGKAGKKVELTVNTKPSFKGSQTTIVTPIDNKAPLYYHRWVQNNIQKVNKATDGQVGYIHIPDMLTKGLNAFVEYYYPQIRKKGLIIDVRGNGGGNVSPMIIERLRREATRAKMTRHMEEGRPHPQMVMRGPMVMLIDEYTASDGDLIAYSFKKHQMGKLIGTRTWGGVIGISGSLPFIDGGSLRIPQYASYSAEKSKWIIEGHGVEPDIQVKNDPHQEYLGKDVQLQKAIEHIKKKIKEEYKPIPPIPDPPVKNKGGN